MFFPLPFIPFTITSSLLSSPIYSILWFFFFSFPFFTLFHSLILSLPSSLPSLPSLSPSPFYLFFSFTFYSTSSRSPSVGSNRICEIFVEDYSIACQKSLHEKPARDSNYVNKIIRVGNRTNRCTTTAQLRALETRQDDETSPWWKFNGDVDSHSFLRNISLTL